MASTDNLRVLSLIPGRVRLHLSGWTAEDAERIEARLSQVMGVKSVQANPLTGNILLQYDPSTTGEQSLLAELQEAWDGTSEAPGYEPPVKGGTGRRIEDQGLSPSLLRVGVRGLLGHAVVDSLWFAAGFLGQSLGLPLAGLGPLHVLMDIAVWGMALRSSAPPSRHAASFVFSDRHSHSAADRKVPC